MRTIKRHIAIAVLLGAGLALHAAEAAAGCGCDKPPPALAPIRPAFASPGDTVTLFPPWLVSGETYTVVFKQSESGDRTRVRNTGVTMRRDYADGVVKPQLVVAAPDLPPGPTEVVVKRKDGSNFKIAANAFTMLQAPLLLPEHDGQTTATCYRAAVAQDGTVYLPVDVSAIAEHMIFSGVGLGYPLLFDADDIAIYNTQGVLMQLLGPAEAGIYAITDGGSPHSFELAYDRHEFVTYREQHAHENGFGLDPADPAWHVDGTRHIDHDHLVLAIRGVLETGQAPQPGETPPFALQVLTALADGSSTGPVATSTIAWSACNGG